MAGRGRGATPSDVGLLLSPGRGRGRGRGAGGLVGGLAAGARGRGAGRGIGGRPGAEAAARATLVGSGDGEGSQLPAGRGSGARSGNAALLAAFSGAQQQRDAAARGSDARGSQREGRADTSDATEQALSGKDGGIRHNEGSNEEGKASAARKLASTHHEDHGRSSGSRPRRKRAGRHEAEVVARGTDAASARGGAGGSSPVDVDAPAPAADSEAKAHDKAVADELRVKSARSKQDTSEAEPECLVCIEPVLRQDPAWQCSRCYVLYHLSCVQAWATNAMKPVSKLLAAVMDVPNVWHCPSCRMEYKEEQYPEHYMCYCGRTTEPADDPWQQPHSCGEPCGRSLGCAHRCTQLCHRGACGPCPQFLRASCYCGKQSTMRRCRDEEFSCGDVCGRRLACGHTCAAECHSGDCPPCLRSGVHACRCGRNKREGPCSLADWSCEVRCGRALACGHHECEGVCHRGDCEPCALAGERTCPCGKLHLTLPCTEATPTCGDTCDRTMECGEHTCPRACHDGPCGDCRVLVRKSCRCGRMTKEKPCCEELLCTIKCPKLRNCGRHACKRRCCAGDCDVCRSTCGRKLTCSNHKCERRCHPGDCQRCTLSEEVTCACGVSVQVVPCGFADKVDPPECTLRCRQPSGCAHEIRQHHECHFGPCPPCVRPCESHHDRCGHACGLPCHDPDPCPPCDREVQRTCVGGHKEKAVRCSAPALFRCSALCGRPLLCGRHRCEEKCHAPDESKGDCGPCERGCDAAVTCSHGCSIGKCHAGACPPCGVTIRRVCFCGREMRSIECADVVERLGRCFIDGDGDIPSELADEFMCGNKCQKPLPGCAHTCPSTCHVAPCAPCEREVAVRCMCGRRQAQWPCVRAQAAIGEVGLAVRAGNGVVAVLDCDAACEAAIAKVEAEATAAAAADAGGGGGGHASASTTATHDPRFEGMTRRQVRDLLLRERQEKEAAAAAAEARTLGAMMRHVSPSCVGKWTLRILLVAAAMCLALGWLVFLVDGNFDRVELMMRRK